MKYPRVQFVSSPDHTATTRFDCNLDDGTVDVGILHDEFTVGVPELEGDPDGVSVDYGPRTLGFTVSMRGRKANTLPRQAALARELLRARNWLLFQLDAGSDPVWFRIYPSQPGEVSFEHVRNGSNSDEWQLPLSLLADPFALGERVALPQVTVSNNNTSSRFLRTTLPTIKGDAPASLRVKVKMTNSTYGAGVGSAWALAVSSGSGPQPILSPVGPPADEWGVVTGGAWASEVADSAYLNGYYLQLGLGSGDAEITWQPASGSVPRGRYKVLIHAAAATDAVETTFTVGQWVASEVVWSTPAVRIVDAQLAGGRSWIDLGEHTFPFGSMLPEDVTGPTSDVDLRIRLSGAGSVRIDEVVLVPMEGDGTDGSTFLGSTFTYWSPGADRDGTWDGDGGAGGVAWVVNASGQLLGTTVQDHGGYPVADPAATNILWAFPTNAGLIDTTATTSRLATWTVDVSYQPRWLWIGGS